jgi:uncharacterized coiled-coil DUF342 family protein
MALFESNKELKERIKQLEKNVDKIYSLHQTMVQSINTLKDEVQEVEKGAPEYEKEAKQYSKKASEYRNKAQDTLNEVVGIKGSIQTHQNEISSIKNTLNELISDFNSEYEEITTSNEEVNTKKEDIFSKVNQLEEKIKAFEEILEEHPNLDEEITNFESIISRIKDNESKSSQLIKSITSRKTEIDTLYNEILGYTEENEHTGEETFVEGLRSELEGAYEGLDSKVNTLKEKFEGLEKSTSDNYNNFLKTNSEKGNKLIDDWEEKYKSLNKKIESLLPNALTAGLSHAFSGKKTEEVEAYEKHKKQFTLGIFSMVAVSLIPFIISLYTLINDTDIDTIINRVPKIVVAILPLYIPVLWLSISSSKKMNLSKRLIEEYSHKEVLSKTFEGLSKQIENLEEEDLSNDLKINLLQNFMHMYSENPGKLISDYNKSDHPLMEMLENSNKLENSIERLKKIPGMEKVVSLLERKSQQKMQQVTQKIEDNLDRLIAIDKDGDSTINPN